MKLLLLILLPFASFCQLNKKKITTPKYHDSTYYETQYDTTFGTMEYYVPNGTVKGNGAIVKMSTWKMNITIPQRPIQYIIKNKDTVGATLSSGAGTLFGFLCLDSSKEDAFDMSIDPEIICGCADGIYNPLKLYVEKFISKKTGHE